MKTIMQTDHVTDLPKAAVSVAFGLVQLALGIACTIAGAAIALLLYLPNRALSERMNKNKNENVIGTTLTYGLLALGVGLLEYAQASFINAYITVRYNDAKIVEHNDSIAVAHCR